MRWRLEDTPEQAAFRESFRDWLRETLEPGWMEAIDAGDEDAFAEVYARAQENGHHLISWMQTIGGQRLRRPPLARGARRPVGRAVGAADRARGAGPLPPPHLRAQHPRRGHGGPDDHRPRQRGAEGALPAEDPHRRGDLVPDVQRAGRRVGPRLAIHAGGARRRRLGDRRPEGLDHAGPVRPLRDAARAHRPRRAQARAG